MSDLDSMYQTMILDAAAEKYGFGHLDHPDGESFQVNPTCGDRVTLQVNMDGNQISHIAWEGDGCSISQASLSIMTEMLEGKDVDEAMEIFDVFRQLMDSRGKAVPENVEEILEDATCFQGVAKFPMRVKCALLGWMALRDATSQALAEQN